MPGFFYYFGGIAQQVVADPRQGTLSLPSSLSSVLGPVFSDRKKVPDHTIVFSGNGPDGGKGVFLYPKPNSGGIPNPITYDPEQQQWIKSDEHEFWVGANTNEDVPTPSDLIRSQPVNGYPLSKSDEPEEWQWVCPIIQSPHRGSSSIPMNVTRRGGRFTETPKAEYTNLWNMTGEVVDHFKDIEKRSIEWQYETAMSFLQINYRVTWETMELMGNIGGSPFDTELSDLILAAACDWPMRRAFADKKKAEESQARD